MDSYEICDDYGVEKILILWKDFDNVSKIVGFLVLEVSYSRKRVKKTLF